MRSLLLALCALCALTAAEGDAYRQVLAAAEAHPHRQPGSAGWTAMADAVAGALRGAGLEANRLSYATMVPQTRTCRLEVDGAEIAGLLALAPNGAMPPTTWGRDLEGPVVWLGDGTLAEMSGLPVEGSIALLRMGSPHLQQVFAQGAKAIVVVGAEATQWQASRLFTEAPVASPRAWLPQAAAEAAGLTANPATPRQGKLRIDVRWADAECADLWVLIPAAAGTAPERAAQTIVLAAELATAGAVPDLSPGRREAANAALLAELAVRLAAQPADRNVLVCFLGSHYGGQEGARQLYWVVNKAATGERNPDRIVHRERAASEQIAVCERRLALLADPGLLALPGDDAFAIRERLRSILVGRINTLNYDSQMRAAQRKEAVAAKDEAGIARADEELKALKARTARLNDIRRQLSRQVMEDAETWRELLDRLGGELAGLRDWLRADTGRLASARRLEEALSGKPVIAHIGIDFAAADRAWFANPFGVDCSTLAEGNSQPGYVVKHIDAWQQAWNRIAANQGSAAPMRAPDLSATYGYELLNQPRRRQVASVVPLSMGVMAAQLVTLGDPLDADEMPAAVPAPDLLPLAAPLRAWLASLTGGEMPLRTGYAAAKRADDRLVWRWDGTYWAGLRVDQLSPGSDEVEGPASGAVLFVNNPLRMGPFSTDADLVCGRFNAPMVRVNPAGHVFCPLVNEQGGTTRVHSIGFGADGAPRSYYDGGQSTSTLAYNIRLFTGFGNGVYFPFLPTDYSGTASLMRLVGRTDSTVKRAFGRDGTGGAVVCTSEARSLKLIGSGLFLLGSTDKRPIGQGLLPDPQALLSLDVLRRSAHDATALNAHRIEVLRSKNLINRAAERVHAGALDHIEMAEAARAGKDVRTAAAHETIAAILAARAQSPLRAGANDLLRAVVILLLLAIPFAFAVERLVLGSVSIFRQIMGFGGIFLATFIILYFTHPAFALAEAPLIIFLAFVIILLSTFVISVVMGKFKRELKLMQGLSQKSHAVGSDNSTALAAVVIGIAGMRNRPLKTFLTASTVTLLTFTILVFSSFQSGSAVVESYQGRSRGIDRIELHQPSFLRIPDRIVDAIETLHGDRFEVVRRTASFRNPLAGTESERQTGNVVLDPATGMAMQLDGLLGLDPRDIARLPAGLFAGTAPAGGPPPLWLSEILAARLSLQPGAEVRIRGKAFILAGTFRSEALKSVENIDGTRLMPPDFATTFASLANRESGSQNQLLQGLDASSFIFSSPALTAVTTNPAVLDLGGISNVVVLYPKADADIAQTAADIAASFNGPVYATSGDGAKRFFYTREIVGGGYLDLVVPLLLGGLIIFSSLLGSIVDRQKEIFTYSALGLSPRDVGTLFFAESSVIAVVGGMGGYLIGQAAAKLLSLLAEQGLVNVPDMNFSSTSSLVTILIVMAMVLLSTIYPAIMASRSANPGINRSWKMPEPDGDRMLFTFPFTVPEKSFGGIVAYVREHFANHNDSSLDVFAARNVELFPVEGGRVGIRADVALAPFDLGVFQRFAMRTRPSDIPGIDEVVVEIERRNGTRGTWLYGNRMFIKDLREQFLIWRSLPPEAVQHYQEAAQQVLDQVAASAGGSHAQG